VPCVAGSSGNASASVPPAVGTGGMTPAQQQPQARQGDLPTGSGGASSGAAGSQQGDDKQDEDEELARAVQDSMDDDAK
jgi:hypothetical protein